MVEMAIFLNMLRNDVQTVAVSNMCFLGFPGTGAGLALPDPERLNINQYLSKSIKLQ